jgi:carbonic anhydrase
MAVADEFVQANQRYAASFSKGDLPMPPGRKVAVVACMDARLDPARALGLEEGDAHVIRNAGGRVADAIRSLIISQQLLGTREVVIVHHTDCGMVTFTDSQLQDQVERNLGRRPDLAFHPFTDLDQSVRDDLEAVNSSPFLLKDTVARGFVYDVKSGTLREVRRG